MSNFLRYSAAFRIRLAEPFPSPADPQVNSVVIIPPFPGDGQLATGSHNYKVFYSVDGVGLLMHSVEATFSELIPTSNRAVRITFPNRQFPELVHWIWKDIGGAPFDVFVGSTDTDEFTDFSSTNDNPQIDKPFTGSSPFQTAFNTSVPVEIPLSLKALGVVTGPTGIQTLTFGAAPEPFLETTITGVNYEDLGNDPERQDQNENINRREIGARPRIELNFKVGMGTEFERKLAQIYSAKLAHPEVKLEFTLNFDNPGPQWEEVQIVGSWPRRPFAGKNQFMDMSWTVVPLRAPTRIALPLVPDGRGEWI